MLLLENYTTPNFSFSPFNKKGTETRGICFVFKTQLIPSGFILLASQQWKVEFAATFALLFLSKLR